MSQSANYMQKLGYLRHIKHLVEEESVAIDAMDLRKLNELIKKAEELFSRMEKLDQNRTGSSSNIRLDEKELDFVAEILREISYKESENIKLLLEKRESVLLELKAIQKKKSARQAYRTIKERKNLISESC
ncbi:MAG: hypothetical protein AB1743_01635 [Actinomycetota bacterium]